MMVPRAFGGGELDHLQACRVVEALARADGSAGWNAQIIFGFNVGIGRFPKHVVEKVLGSRGDVRVRGSLAPLGRAVSSDGGVIVSGQWPLASGSFEPAWIIALTLIFSSEEHTSELQSLMSISYDVFCLKKTTINTFY